MYKYLYVFIIHIYNIKTRQKYYLYIYIYIIDYKLCLIIKTFIGNVTIIVKISLIFDIITINGVNSIIWYI